MFFPPFAMSSKCYIWLNVWRITLIRSIECIYKRLHICVFDVCCRFVRKFYTVHENKRKKAFVLNWNECHLLKSYRFHFIASNVSLEIEVEFIWKWTTKLNWPKMILKTKDSFQSKIIFVRIVEMIQSLSSFLWIISKVIRFLP